MLGRILNTPQKDTRTTLTDAFIANLKHILQNTQPLNPVFHLSFSKSIGLLCMIVMVGFTIPGDSVMFINAVFLAISYQTIVCTYNNAFQYSATFTTDDV